MSVLEDYSDQDCSALLGCTRRDVFAARTRALHQIGRLVELLSQQANAGLEDAVFNRHSPALVAVG
jgi:hypothetical protein